MLPQTAQARPFASIRLRSSRSASSFVWSSGIGSAARHPLPSGTDGVPMRRQMETSTGVPPGRSLANLRAKSSGLSGTATTAWTGQTTTH